MNFSKANVHSFSKSKRGKLYSSTATPGPGAYQYSKEYNLKKISGVK